MAYGLVVEGVLLLLWAPLISFLFYNPELSGDAALLCVADIAGVSDVAYVSTVAGVPSVDCVPVVVGVPNITGVPCFADVPAVPCYLL